MAIFAGASHPAALSANSPPPPLPSSTCAAGFDGSEFLADLWLLHVIEPPPPPPIAYGVGVGAVPPPPAPVPATFRWERIERARPSDYWAEVRETTVCQHGDFDATPVRVQPRSGGGMVAYRNCLVVYGGRCRRDGRVSFSDRVEVFSFGETAFSVRQCRGCRAC